MISKYDEFQLLNEAILNEEFDFSKIKDSIKNVADKNKVLNYLINKFNHAKKQPIRKHIAILLIAVFLINFGIKSNKWANNLSAHEIQELTDKIAQQQILSQETIADVININQYIVEEPKMFGNQEFIDATNLHTSDKAIKLIKKHERLRLKGYKIGDKRITIGYGHAELIKTSTYKIGDRITRKQANELFKKDLSIAESGIKRMFQRWKDAGIKIELTQNMFDAMVSMTFNMGVYGMATTDFIQHIKRGDFETAADSIRTTKISDKFPGLEDRREDEYELFTSQS